MRDIFKTSGFSGPSEAIVNTALTAKGEASRGTLSRHALAALAVLACLAALYCGCKRSRGVSIGGLEVVHALPLEWTELEKGLAAADLEYVREEDGRVISIVAVRVSPARFRFGLLDAPQVMGAPLAAPSDMALKTSAIVAVNGGFFLPPEYKNKPTGLVVSKGKVLSRWKKGAGSGIFAANDKRAVIDWASEYDADWEKADLAIQAGPLLVEPDSKPGIYKDSRKYRMRTAVGLDEDGNVILVCTRRVSEKGVDLIGLDLYELMQIMIHPQKKGGLGAKRALNLDGGPSSAIHVDHEKYKLTVKGASPVRNGVAVFEKK